MTRVEFTGGIRGTFDRITWTLTGGDEEARDALSTRLAMVTPSDAEARREWPYMPHPERDRATMTCQRLGFGRVLGEPPPTEPGVIY